MSLITNIIHDEFALVIANKPKKNNPLDFQNFEKLMINKSHNVMMSISGKEFPKPYSDAFKQSSTADDAIMIMQEYINDAFSVNELIISYNTLVQQDIQQISLCYFDEKKQKFCSYAASVSNQHRNIEIKSSIPNQVLYRCIGTESDQLTSLFQLKGIRSALQQFAVQHKGMNAVMEIVDMTQKMYDVIHLIDHANNFEYKPKYWAIDRESKVFQKVNYQQRYFTQQQKIA